MDFKTTKTESYLKPELEVLEMQTCDVLASSDMNGGQIEDVNFENWII